MNIKPLPKINARAAEYNRWAQTKMGEEGVRFRVWGDSFSEVNLKGDVNP